MPKLKFDQLANSLDLENIRGKALQREPKSLKYFLQKAQQDVQKPCLAFTVRYISLTKVKSLR